MKQALATDAARRRRWILAALIWVCACCAFVLVAVGVAKVWTQALPYNASFWFWVRVPFTNTVYRFSTNAADSAASSGPMIDIEDFQQSPDRLSGGGGQWSFYPHQQREFEIGDGGRNFWMKGKCEVRGFNDRNVLLNIIFSGGADNPDAIAHPQVHSALVTVKPGEPVILYPYDNMRVVVRLRDPGTPFKGYPHLWDPI